MCECKPNSVGGGREKERDRVSWLIRVGRSGLFDCDVAGSAAACRRHTSEVRRRQMVAVSSVEQGAGQRLRVQQGAATRRRPLSVLGIVRPRRCSHQPGLPM